MSFTFAELKTAIQDYTENQETTFVNHLNDFIRGAEERILKSVQLSFFRKNATGSMTSGNKFLAVPSDFLAPFSLSITSSSEHIFLLYKDVNFIQEVNPNPATTGIPKYYAYFDVNNLVIAPTPNADFVSELHYLYRPNSLTAGADSGTTWLSENADRALLYGSLLEAYTFMKGEPDVLQQYEKMFAEAIGRLKNFGEALEVTDAYRQGQLMRQKS
jgi:hypothetical protein